MFGGGGINGNMPIPQSLEQLLERQWEQGSQFLMEQAQHFDSEYGYKERERERKEAKEGNLFTKQSSLFFSCFAAELPASAAERESAPGGACDQSHRSPGSSASG